MGSCAVCKRESARVGCATGRQYEFFVKQHRVDSNRGSAHFPRLETRTKEFIRCIKDFFV